jgi:signal transduction histidine kinase
MQRVIKKFATDLRIRAGYGTAFSLLLVCYMLTLYVMITRYHALPAMIVISLVIAFLISVYGFITYSRENRARRQADRKVFEYQEQMKERIVELDKANKELIRIRSIEKFAASGRIARTIAHEIRNPLTNINLATDQLKVDLEGKNGNTTVILELIDRNSLRIDRLVTGLLNSTKFADLARTRVSVNQLLDEVLEMAKERIRVNNIVVSKNYTNDICDISVDREKIKIAFLNIVVNAIEAMEPGKGILQLRTTNKDGKCMVIIRDNGPGIDTDTLSKLFEPYFTSKPQNAGLGLTHTQNIILNHDGSINTESEPGKGTSFTISLDFA